MADKVELKIGDIIKMKRMGDKACRNGYKTSLHRLQSSGYASEKTGRKRF